jgi:hypothetical protein
MVELQVVAVGHVAEEPDVRVRQHALQGLDDLLDARVVGRDAVADEPERGRVALDEIDGD